VAELTPFVVWALSGGGVPLALGVLQILCLDVGTDQLPALALGVEPPSATMLDGPPTDRKLIDGALLRRVFGVLGPTEALLEMAAFGAVLLTSGWRPGGQPPDGAALLAASGAAFSTVILGQAANAFACRSTTRSPNALGWRTNPVLLMAVGIQLLMLVGFLYLPPVSAVLGHASPPPIGWIIAAAAVPAVLMADALQKRLMMAPR
jgi:magnesium-transporting ATPase (P-type)